MTTHDPDTTGDQKITPKRWGLLSSSRMYVVYQATKEEAVEVFANTFQIDPALIENMVDELGPSSTYGLVDRAPARETR